MLAKYVLMVTGAEAKEACGAEQLCRGLEAGIEGGIHAVRLLWKNHAQEEDWGFLLIDTRNPFNEKNRTSMLWEVRHEWPSGAQFGFNCYCHWATLVIRAGYVTGNFLYSKKGVTQGNPLDVVAYGLEIIPIIQELRKAHPGMRMTLGRAEP